MLDTTRPLIDQIFAMALLLLILLLVVGLLPVAEILVKTGRVKNRFVALGVGLLLLIPVDALLTFVWWGIPRLWVALPTGVTGVLGTILIAVFVLIAAAGTLLGIAGRLIYFWVDTEKPGTPRARTEKILDTLQQQTEGEAQPEIALTLNSLREELDKQGSAAFRQSILLTVVSFVAGLATTLALQWWTTR